MNNYELELQKVRLIKKQDLRNQIISYIMLVELFIIIIRYFPT